MSPPKNSIRPASDLVRQAVFNMLRWLLDDKIFYDVFAGTGIVGLEALSRGAKRAIFVEQDRRQIDLIRRNLEIAKFTAEANLRNSDAFTWARHFATHDQPTIVFLGPPYPLFDKERLQMFELVAGIQKELKPGDYLVFQYPRFVKPEELPLAEDWWRMRHYGKTRIGIWTPVPPDGEEDADDSVHEAEDGDTDAVGADDDSAPRD
jgi:16S rRNA (guanine966-N2)-methyltransferase